MKTFWKLQLVQNAVPQAVMGIQCYTSVVQLSNHCLCLASEVGQSKYASDPLKQNHLLALRKPAFAVAILASGMASIQRPVQVLSDNIKKVSENLAVLGGLGIKWWLVLIGYYILDRVCLLGSFDLTIIFIFNPTETQLNVKKKLECLEIWMSAVQNLASKEQKVRLRSKRAVCYVMYCLIRQSYLEWEIS